MWFFHPAFAIVDGFYLLPIHFCNSWLAVFRMLMVFVCHSLRTFCASSNSSFISSTRCIACAYCLTACWRSKSVWSGSYGLLAFWMSSALGSIPASFSHFSLCSIHFDCLSRFFWAISLSFLVPCHGLMPSIRRMVSRSLFCLSIRSWSGVWGDSRPSDSGSFCASWQVVDGSWYWLHFLWYRLPDGVRM